MKKFASLALASVMMLGSVSAFAEEWTPAAEYDTGERTYVGAPVTTAANAGDSGSEVSTAVFPGTEGKDYTDEGYYTYNDVMTRITGLDWNPHTWETNEDSYILNYITMGFYDFAVNENADGYSVVCEMAAELPQDVTSEYVGSYGVEEGETAKAWRIALNPDATWENGEPINADTYIYSYKELLNPKMINRRADSLYSGDFEVVNAKNYVYAGQTMYNPLPGTVDEAIEAGEEVYLDLWNLWGMEGMTDADGNPCPQYVSVNDETQYRDEGVAEDDAEAWISGKYIYETYFAAGMDYEAYGSTYGFTAQEAEGASWDEVGFKKVDDYTIDIILKDPIAEPAFYMPYNLSSNYLVYEPLYEQCKSFYDADGNAVETEEEADSITTTYCTDLDTTIGYGPYKLTYYELDKQITMERNDEWYGYKDGKHLGQYQTDRIVCQAIEEHATQLMSFLAGEIDGVSLQADDMEAYASSDYILYEPQSYTTKISFNTMYDKLLEHGTNSQILVIDEFRQAFKFAMNREEFATAYTSAGTAGFGILNNMYVYDPFTGALYRDSEEAKAALCNIYGLSWGEGGDYATLDEAYEAMTGYDMAKAQELMKTAYDKAVESGIYDGESDITIDFRVYSNDTIYVQMFTYIENQLKEACAGSGFEGKISMTMTVDADYYTTMYSGGADVIFTTWGGASMSPFTILSNCYTDDWTGNGNQMEVGFNTEEIMLTINVDGTDITDSLYNWTQWAGAEHIDSLTEALGNFADYDYATRCALYANMEECYLSYATTTPIYYRNVASLYSQKTNNATNEYLQLVGFGGTRYLTYNYTDDEWTEYIANNELQY